MTQDVQHRRAEKGQGSHAGMLRCRRIRKLELLDHTLVSLTVYVWNLKLPRTIFRSSDPTSHRHKTKIYRLILLGETDAACFIKTL